MKQKGAGSQCVRRTNIGSLSFRGSAGIGAANSSRKGLLLPRPCGSKGIGVANFSRGSKITLPC